MSRVLVTGASGFVGRALVARLVADGGWAVRGSFRTQDPEVDAGIETVHVGDLGARTDWRQAVAGVDVLVHTAARVHVMRESAADPISEFRRVNVDGTLALARQAASAGVRRFVFISSVKVNGEGTERGHPYTAADTPAPIDPYGMSKWEAELGLFGVARETGMAVTVVRPVLVYGPGVKGNFLTLMRWLEKGMPLPLGGIDNRRSLVALDNLVDLVMTCLDHPAAEGRVFMVSDGDDLSTPDLLRRVAAAMGRQARLLPVPPAVLTGAARLIGKGDLARRLCGSLEVDITATRELLGWSPVVSLDQALAGTVRQFLARRLPGP